MQCTNSQVIRGCPLGCPDFHHLKKDESTCMQIKNRFYSWPVFAKKAFSTFQRFQGNFMSMGTLCREFRIIRKLTRTIKKTLHKNNAKAEKFIFASIFVYNFVKAFSATF